MILTHHNFTRFERQWGAMTQKLRARSNRARVEASLLKIIKGQWRPVEPSLHNELNDLAVRLPKSKIRAIRSWQATNLINPDWSDRESVATSTGDWKIAFNWVMGDDDDHDEIMKYMEYDLQLEEIITGDHVTIEVCSGLNIMHREFKPYSGHFSSANLSPFAMRKIFRSYVSLKANRGSHRYSKCAAQVISVYRITQNRSDVKIGQVEACEITTFRIHKERLYDGPPIGWGDDAPSRISIIKEPFIAWRSRRGTRSRNRFVLPDQIYSACLIVPRVRVPVSTHADLRYHQYHLIELRR